MVPPVGSLVVLVYLAARFLTTRLRSRQIAQALRDFPVGLEVSHFPNPASASRSGEIFGWRYLWHFETTVRVTVDRPLRIEQFGMGVWHRGRWLYSRNRSAIVLGPYTSPNCTAFSGDDFIREFDCPGGWLEPGVEVRDRRNWAGSARRKAFRQNWFFVGRDEEGLLYKGEAIIDFDGHLA